MWNSQPRRRRTPVLLVIPVEAPTAREIDSVPAAGLPWSTLPGKRRRKLLALLLRCPPVRITTIIITTTTIFRREKAYRPPALLRLPQPAIPAVFAPP